MRGEAAAFTDSTPGTSGSMSCTMRGRGRLPTTPEAKGVAVYSGEMVMGEPFGLGVGQKGTYHREHGGRKKVERIA